MAATTVETTDVATQVLATIVETVSRLVVDAKALVSHAKTLQKESVKTRQIKTRKAATSTAESPGVEGSGEGAAAPTPLRIRAIRAAVGKVITPSELEGGGDAVVQLSLT